MAQQQPKRNDIWCNQEYSLSSTVSLARNAVVEAGLQTRPETDYGR